MNNKRCNINLKKNVTRFNISPENLRLYFDKYSKYKHFHYLHHKFLRSCNKPILHILYELSILLLILNTIVDNRDAVCYNL